MSDNIPPQYADFVAEVRSFLQEKLTFEAGEASKRQAGMFADDELSRYWHGELYKRGWVAPNWPIEHGGPGWDPMERFLFHDEMAKAGAPKPPTIGLQLCGPVIMRFGTAEQKQFYLPRILSGEHMWCQGYSEPEAGSDLASLRTSARREGDVYVVNGSKIWTTNAHNSNWIFLLVRTDPSARQQDGISFLLVPMDTPGLTVRPIISMSGEHELNEVFFDDVRVPVVNRVGDENAGWLVAKYLLEFERGAGANAGRIRKLLSEARRLAKDMGGQPEGSSLWDESPAFRRKIALAEIDAMFLAFSEQRVAALLASGQPVGSIASQLKLSGSMLFQEATELCLEGLGPYFAVDQIDALGSRPTGTPVGPLDAAAVTARYLNGRAVTVYGGTKEVQHNILARMIGL